MTQGTEERIEHDICDDYIRETQWIYIQMHNNDSIVYSVCSVTKVGTT